MAIGSGVLLPGVAENPTFPILRPLAYTTGLGYCPTCDMIVLLGINGHLVYPLVNAHPVYTCVNAHRVDDGGRWGYGGLFTHINSVSQRPRQLYTLAGNMKGLLHRYFVFTLYTLRWRRCVVVNMLVSNKV